MLGSMSKNIFPTARGVGWWVYLVKCFPYCMRSRMLGSMSKMFFPTA